MEPADKYLYSDTNLASYLAKKRFIKKGFLLLLFALLVVFITANPQIQLTFYNTLARLHVFFLRNSGLVRPTVTGYFAALKNQNLLYDFNDDGAVTGDDYAILLKTREPAGPDLTALTIPSEAATTDAASEAESQGYDLPSVKNFSSDDFTGTATVSYPINLPTGMAGLTPSLSLSYSSASVDDLLVGVKTKWRNDPEHSYQRQAGLIGLGWNLGGLQSITRDIKGTLNDPSDDVFMITFAGGAATLSKESDDGAYSLWRTLPNLKIRVERWSRCKTHKTNAGDMVICRYNWLATSPDGTKYYFGSPATVNNWKRAYDPENEYFAEGAGNDWYPLYDDYDGTRTWMIFGSDAVGWHALTYKWLLSKVESVFDSSTNNIEIKYRTHFELGDYKGKKYVKATYPYSIEYGKHKVEFTLQNRFDYKIHDGSLANPRQSFFSSQRIKKIVVKTNDKVVRAYVLGYVYGWDPTKHNDNGNGVVNNDAEVVGGQAIHSLLRSITVYDDDPDVNTNAKNLPSYTFNYGANCENFRGGCPLKSFVADGGGTQVRTPNDFFLVSAANGYKGKVTFEYYQDASGGNALPIKYCDEDKATYSGGGCKQDVAFNTQRHRVSAKIVEDGMGASVRTELAYGADGASVGLAYVKGYGDEYYEGKNCCNVEEGKCLSGQPSGCNCPTTNTTCVTSQGWDCVGGTSCGWKNASGLCCPSDLPITKVYKCTNPANSNQYICPGTPTNPNVTCYSNCKYRSEPFAGFEFLGYPEVTTTVYEKNSTTKVVYKSKSYFHQKIETTSCFKPSPLKGMLKKIEIYDAQNQNRWIEQMYNFKVRFGPMFGPYEEKTPNELAEYCSTFDPEKTVAQVMQTAQISKSYMPNPSLCTRVVTSYDNLDGSSDPYAMVHKVINQGKVNCDNPSQNDLSDTNLVTFTNYTDANEIAWILPKPAETWLSNSENGLKYKHTRTLYDGKTFGNIGSFGQVTKTQTVVSDVVYAVSSIEYDATYPWLIVKTTDPLGRTTTTEYDGQFRMYPTKVTNHLGQTITTNYDFNIGDTAHPNYGGVLGLPVKVWDANGVLTTYVYDSFGRPIETYLAGRKPGTNLPNQFTKYYYFNQNDKSTCNDDNNCLTGLGVGTRPKMMVYSTTMVSDAGSIGQVSATHTYYNGLGQEVQTRSLFYANEWVNAGIPVEGEGLRDLITSKSYNGLGQVEYASLTYTANPYVPNGASSFDTRDFITDTTIKTIRNQYDGFGRLSKTTTPGVGNQVMEYDIGGDPLKTKSLDPNCTDTSTDTPCAEKIVTKNAFGQIVQTEEVGGGNTYKTSVEYHPVLGQVTRTIDTRGNPISIIEYDTLGRKAKMWDIDMSPAMSGDASAWIYEYDKIGNLIKQVSPKGDISELSYDGLNRLLTKKVNSKLLLANAYDTCTNGVGRICEETSYDLNGKILQKVAYEYNRQGLVSRMTKTLSNMPNQQINNKNFVTEFTYDIGGRIQTRKNLTVTALGIPEETLDYQYANSPYLVTIKGNQNYITAAKYNKGSQLVSFTSGNGVVNSYSYNENNLRLTGLNVEGSQFSAADKLNLAYSYDPAGNIKQIKDTNAAHAASAFNLNQSFSYDELYRLTNATGAYTANYTYDNIGNILTKNEGSQKVNLSYSDINGGFYHRPKTGDVAGITQTFTYDKIGNMTADGSRFYEFDADNRLVKVSPEKVHLGSSQGREVFFYYDAAGQRIAKVVSGGRSTYYITPELEVVILPDQKVYWRKNYYFSGKLIAVREGPDPIPLLNEQPGPSATPSATPAADPTADPSASPESTPSAAPTPTPDIPTPTPTFNMADLVEAITAYLDPDTLFLDAYFQDGKVNALDCGWIIKWLTQ